MPDIHTEPSEDRSGSSDRRRPNPASVQAWEALAATESEFTAANAKLSSANHALDAARQREDRLLEIIDKGQTRLHRILLGTAITALSIIILLSLIVALIVNT